MGSAVACAGAELRIAEWTCREEHVDKGQLSSLEHAAFHVNAVVQAGLVESGLDLDVDGNGCLEVVVAAQRDIRLNDGEQALVLANQSVAGEVLRCLGGEGRELSVNCN